MRRAWNWLRQREARRADGEWTNVNDPASEAQAPLNRRQRRLYLRYVQESEHPTPLQRRERRRVRKYVVGFGKWRTARAYLERSYTPHLVSDQRPPRAVRRAEVSRRARRRLAAR